VIETLTSFIVDYRWLWLAISIVFLAIDLWDGRWMILRKREIYRDGGRRGLWGEALSDYVLQRLQGEAYCELRARPWLHYSSMLSVLVFFAFFLLSFVL
jgi:hypothetical protein